MINFNNIKSKIILFVNIYNIQLLQLFLFKDLNKDKFNK